MAFPGSNNRTLMQAITQQSTQPIQTGPTRSQLVADILSRRPKRQAVSSIPQGLAQLAQSFVERKGAEKRADEQITQRTQQQEALASALQGAFDKEQPNLAPLAQLNPQLAAQLQGRQFQQEQFQAQQRQQAQTQVLARERFDANESFRERQLDLKERELGVKAASVAAKGEANIIAKRTGKVPAGYRPSETDGIEAIPGGPADPKNPNSPIAKEVRAAKSVQADLLAKTERYKDALKKHGTEFSFFGISGDAQKEIESTYTDLLLSAKEFLNLGVLNGPDLDIMRQLVPDPTTIGAQFSSTQSFINNLDNQFRQSILDQEKTLQNVYGADVWGSEISGKTPTNKKDRPFDEIMAEFGGNAQ